MTQQAALTGTYLDHMLAALAGGGDRVAVIDGERRISFIDAHDAVLRLANTLLGQGIRRGDGVAIFTAANRPEAVFLQLAVHLIGCRLIFVPPEPGKDELIAYVRQADPQALVFDPGVSSLALALAGQFPLPVVLSFGPAPIGTDLLELMTSAPAVLPDVTGTQDDIVTVFYTGGTTGWPKLVTHRHRYYDNLVFVASRRRMDSTESARVLICTLVTHPSGHVSAMAFLLAGATIMPVKAFDAAEVLALIGQEAVTGLVLVPPMLYDLLDDPALPQRRFPALTRIHYSGAPTAPARLRQAIERFGPIMRQTYGLTEVPVITILEPHEHDAARPQTLRSSGRPMPGTEIEIRDEHGVQVPAGQVGEVRVRSASVMTEYWDDQARTREALHDGWLQTGDLGYLDESGALYLVDRSKDVIITGPVSDNVYSRLLDDFLVTLAGVRHAAAVGAPDDRYGEAVHVFVVPEPGARLDPGELKKQVVEELGESYEPRHIIFVEALPWTAMGKIDKKALRVVAGCQPEFHQGAQQR